MYHHNVRCKPTSSSLPFHLRVDDFTSSFYHLYHIPLSSLYEKIMFTVNYFSFAFSVSIPLLSLFISSCQSSPFLSSFFPPFVLTPFCFNFNLTLDSHNRMFHQKDIVLFEKNFFSKLCSKIQ